MKRTFDTFGRYIARAGHRCRGPKFHIPFKTFGSTTTRPKSGFSSKPPKISVPAALSSTYGSDFDCSTTSQRGRSRRYFRMLQRLGTQAVGAMASRGSLTLAAGTCAGIWTIAAIEAMVLLSGGGSVAAVSSHALFVWAYGAVQVLPSCIWSTVPAETVAAAFEVSIQSDSHGVPPATAVVVEAMEGVASQPLPDPRSTSTGGAINANVVAESRRQLCIHMLQSCRSLLGGSVLLSQVFRAIGLSQRAVAGLEARTSSGRESMLPGVRERVVRLSGRSSDATALSLRIHGEHVVPVFEEPRRIAHLVTAVQRAAGAPVPVFWRVEPGEYGFRHSWEGIGFHDEWLVRTSTGRRLLVVEADATNSEEALALGGGSKDLSLEDATQAARVLERAARKQLSAGRFRMLRVFLGDSRQEFESGSGVRVSLRDRVRAHRSMDVVIDSRAPVLLALLKWTGRLAHQLRLKRTKDGDGAGASTGTSSRRGRAENDDHANGARGLSWMQRRWQPSDWFGGVRGDWSGKQQEQEGVGFSEEQDQGQGGDGQTAPGLEEPSSMPLLSDDHLHSCAPIHADDSDATGSSVRPALVLSTSEPDYFASLSSLLGEYGFHVIDHAALTADQAVQLPHVFYHRTTAETVTAAMDLVRAGAVEPRLCCAIVDKVEGAEDLREFMGERAAASASASASAGKSTQGRRDSSGPPDSQQAIEAESAPEMEIVCAAELYESLFHQVREWAREGLPAGQIQGMLDETFGDVLQQQAGLESTVEEEASRGESSR